MNGAVRTEYSPHEAQRWWNHGWDEGHFMYLTYLVSGEEYEPSAMTILCGRSKSSDMHRELNLHVPNCTDVRAVVRIPHGVLNHGE